MQRFIYNASAFAIGGRFTKPFDCEIETFAACVLPSIGGKARASATRFELKAPDGHTMLAFDSAETNIEGVRDNGRYVTEVRTHIQNLNVGDVLKIDEVIGRLVVRYDVNLKKSDFDPTGSEYRGCRINGRPFDVTVDAEMGRQGSDYEKFKRDHPGYPVCKGKVHYALGRNPDLKFEGDDNGWIYEPDFGKIYFAEWTCGPGIQDLSMLRLKLGSPQEGEIEGGGGSSNGSEYP